MVFVDSVALLAYNAEDLSARPVCGVSNIPEPGACVG